MPSLEFDEDALKEAAADSKDLQDAIKERADDIADAVRSGTPGDVAPTTIDVAEVEDGGWRVFSDAFVMVWLEFGTGMRENRYGANRGEGPAFHMFLHAAEGSGLRYEPGGD
jgi:hypothetical protein